MTAKCTPPPRGAFGQCTKCRQQIPPNRYWLGLNPICDECTAKEINEEYDRWADALEESGEWGAFTEQAAAWQADRIESSRMVSESGVAECGSGSEQPAGPGSSWNAGACTGGESAGWPVDSSSVASGD